MPAAKLDATDLKILDAIQRDGRITKLALAEKVGLSPTPCWTRLARLEKAGIVSGYHARVSMRAVAPIATVLMEVTLANHRRRTSSDSSARSATLPRSSPAGRWAAAWTTC